MGLQSRVMTVLLIFRPIFSYLPKNQTTEFHAKILSVDKSNDGLQEFRPKEFSRGLFTLTFTPLQFSESFSQNECSFVEILNFQVSLIFVTCLQQATIFQISNISTKEHSFWLKLSGYLRVIRFISGQYFSKKFRYLIFW